MTHQIRTASLVFIVFALILFTGMFQSWNSALLILNMGLVSAILSIGVNLQWGVAGLFNVGVMGFVALGGLTVVIISEFPVDESWRAGGIGILVSLLLGAITIFTTFQVYRRMRKGYLKTLLIFALLIGGFVLFRALFDPATQAVEDINPASAGNLGGLGLPVLLAWAYWWSNGRYNCLVSWTRRTWTSIRLFSNSNTRNRRNYYCGDKK